MLKRIWLMAMVVSSVGFAVDYDCRTVSREYEDFIAGDLNAPKGISGNCEKGDGRFAMAVYTLYHEAPVLYQFIKRNVRKIELFSQGDAFHYNAGEARFEDRVVKMNSLHIIGQYEAIIATLLHEAGHLCLTERHVMCGEGNYKGIQGCDPKFTGKYAGGAINVELMALRYLRNKGRHPSHISDYFLEMRMNSTRTRLLEVDEVAWERWFRDRSSMEEPPACGENKSDPSSAFSPATTSTPQPRGQAVAMPADLDEAKRRIEVFSKKPASNSSNRSSGTSDLDDLKRRIQRFVN